MAEIMGIGMFHGPQPGLTDETMANVYFKLTLANPDTPAELRDPANWPIELQKEWGDDEALSAARAHREEAIAGCRRARAIIDEFAPEVIVIFADDQYENFREDVLPPFCVYAMDECGLGGFREGVPGGSGPTAFARPLEKPPLQETLAGSRRIGTELANELVLSDFDVACSWRLHHLTRLGHAFSHSIDYLDWDRRGFPYTVIPFHVSCYGADLKVPAAGGKIVPGRLMEGVDQAPPASPTPRRCYDLGRRVAEILAASPYRALVIGSSSWSHASLTPMHGYLWGDVESDRHHLEQLRQNQFAAWRDLSPDELRASGQHEMLNWICLAGAMEGRRAEVLAYAETYVFNSSKCVAAFR
ncbi:MAG TPA: hypothetical protein VKV23_07375 [Acidimicrobiales bacterium]|nr:hypothetical protein [Acidimicrobiales bacterium]